MSRHNTVLNMGLSHRMRHWENILSWKLSIYQAEKNITNPIQYDYAPGPRHDKLEKKRYEKGRGDQEHIYYIIIIIILL